MAFPELERLVRVTHTLRQRCPWDAGQTHASLVTHLIEEVAEVIEAIETSSGDDHLAEELGDLLLQVVFHAEIASQEGRFTLEDVAARISDKLVRRHPWVFDAEAVPDDLIGSWERSKGAEKGRSSSLEGIPAPLSSLARATKVVARARAHAVPVHLADAAVTADAVGQEVLALVARAQASGIDADQAVRAAVRDLEGTIRTLEG